jgi:hypothetical protein
MITATYNTPASDWTRAIDAALVEWSKHIVGNAVLRITLVVDKGLGFLASHTAGNCVSLGQHQGRAVALPNAAARLQGWDGPGPDFTIKINPTYPWSFGPIPEADKYWAPGVMLHELGHALFMTQNLQSVTTPFEIWASQQDQDLFHNVHHFDDEDMLMSKTVLKGQSQAATALDLQAAAASSIPTKGNNTIYLIPGARVSGGGGNDVAVWLGPFSRFNAVLTNIQTLELRGDNPLTQTEADLYRLYRAAFGRIPDLGGYTWWSKQNRALDDIARAFVDSPEFKAMFGGATRSALVEKLYRHILGRAPDPSGYQYWVGRTDLSDAELLVRFTLAEENVIGVPTFAP